MKRAQKNEQPIEVRATPVEAANDLPPVTYTVDRVVDPVRAALLKETLLLILRPKG